MLDFLLLFLLGFIVFFVIDMIWLGFIARNLYQKQIGHLLKKDVNWAAAIIFYLLFIAGLVLFVILPATNNGQFTDALFMGALFGLITYATYDLTNLATLKDWPIKITLIDLTWGTFLGASTASITYLLFQLFS